MKKIGLVGGIGPASTVEYYLRLVELCKSERGFYPEIIIDSVDMELHTALFDKEDYEKIGDLLVESLKRLKAGGAEVAAITAGTEHIVWDKIKERLPIKTVSIVEAAVDEIKAKDFQKVLIFATVWTIKSGLYENAFKNAGITPIVPTQADSVFLGNLIYPNLENGIVIREGKEKMIELAEKYIAQYKADALLLGCTEIPLMIKENDVSVPIIDTAKVHIRRILDEAIK